MAFRLGEAAITLRANMKPLTQGLSQAMGKIRGFTGGLRGLQTQLEGVSRTARNLSIGAGLGLGASIHQAAQAEATMARFRQVFGDQARAAEAFAEEFANSLNRSKITIADNLAVFQSFFIGLDVGRDRARELSQQMIELATDFAAFNDISEREAMDRFISGLSGSSEVLQLFGINLKAAQLDQELLNMGIQKNTANASEQAKTLARVNLILKTMTDQGAIGQAKREVDQFSEIMKQLQASLKDTSVVIGQAILPAVTKLAKGVRDLMPNLRLWLQQNQSLIPSIIKWGGAIAGVLFVLPKLIAGIRGVIAVAGALKGAFIALRGAAIGVKTALIGTGVGALAAAAWLISEAFTRVKTSFEQASDRMLEFQSNATNFKSALEAMTDAQRRFQVAMQESNQAAANKQLEKQVGAMREMVDAMHEIVREGGLKQIFGKELTPHAGGAVEVEAAIDRFKGILDDEDLREISQFGYFNRRRDFGRLVSSTDLLRLLKSRLSELEAEYSKVEKAAEDTADQVQKVPGPTGTPPVFQSVIDGARDAAEAVGAMHQTIGDAFRDLFARRGDFIDQLRIMERTGLAEEMERIRQQERDDLRQAAELGFGPDVAERIRAAFDRMRAEARERFEETGDAADPEAPAPATRRRRSRIIGSSALARQLSTANIGKDPQEEVAKNTKKGADEAAKQTKQGQQQAAWFQQMVDGIGQIASRIENAGALQ